MFNDTLILGDKGKLVVTRGHSAMTIYCGIIALSKIAYGNGKAVRPANGGKGRLP